MTIRRKALSVVGVTFAVLVAIIYAVLHGTLLRRFDDYEARGTRQTLRRVLQGLTDDLGSLHSLASDWARWDDLYAFVGGRNPRFVSANVVDETFRNVQLAAMVFLDARGRLVLGRGFDLEAGRPAPAPAGLLARLGADSPLRHHPDLRTGVQGILMLPEGPFLVTSWPILTSEGQGPARGTLIWGRFLSPQRVERLAARMGVTLTLHRLDDPALPADVRAAGATLTPEAPRQARPLDDGRIAGYGLLTDLAGRPALVARVVEPRLVHQQGRAFAGYLIGSLLVVVVVSGGVLARLLERLLVVRLERLSAAIDRIRSSQDLSARLPAAGRDELGHLAGDINSMLTSLERSEGSLHQQLARIGLLNQITRAMADRQDLESIFRVVLGRLESELPLDFAEALRPLPAGSLAVTVVGPESADLAARLGTPEGGEIAPADAGLEGCLRGGELHVTDTAEAAAPRLRALGALGIRALVAIPLAVDHEVLGVLVGGRRAVDGFSEAERAFLSRLGEHVALAAYQARLHRELRQAYENLRRTQQAVMQQERLRALGQMASGIAHDVNNALAPVVAFPDLILRHEPQLGERSRRFLAHVRTAGEDISHTVARLREFYRERADEDVLRPVELNRLVGQVADLTRPRWKDMTEEQGRAVELSTELGTNVPAVLGIESELREALTNLVFNAVDAMPAGGRLTLRTRLDGERVALEVIDTGTGMDAATRDRCLEPFFTTKGERGTGLGLAMVYGIARRHEGAIEIDSAVGGGTTMRLLLPVPAPDTADPEACADTPTVVPPLRILCADDEATLRELLRELLTEDGHAVTLADGGAGAVDAFRAARRHGQPFDVVITDLGMPHVDGREVARLVKAESPITPVILLTGWAPTPGEQDRPVPGVDVRLVKPPRIRSLREAVARAASGVGAPAAPLPAR